MLDIGMVGIQGFGRTSLDLLQKRQDVSVTALCDVNETEAQRVAHQRGIPYVFSDFRELLASGTVGAVVIATPHFLHHPMTMAALNAGVDVFCEKPLALTAAEAWEMADAAKRMGRILSCNYSKRQSFPVRALKAWVQSGRLGVCYHANARWQARWTDFMFDTATTWRTQPEKSGGGIFIGRGSHLLDSLLFILGTPKITAIDVVLHNRLTGFPVEDFAQATLRLQNGGTLHIECSYVLPTPLWRESLEYEVFGTCGGAVYNQHDDLPPVWKVGTLDLADGGWQDMTEALADEMPPAISPLDSFVDAVLRGTPLSVTADSAAFISHLLAAGYESARLGREVTLEGTEKQ